MNASVGQPADVPVHVSTASQEPAEARHSVAEDRNALPGQVADDPVHFSAKSQTPAELRHTVAEDRNALEGQNFEEPVHFSDTSQEPAESRHVEPETLSTLEGQLEIIQRPKASVAVHVHTARKEQLVAGLHSEPRLNKLQSKIPPAVAVCVGIAEVRVPINAINAISNDTFFVFTTLEKNILHNTSYATVCLDYELQLLLRHITCNRINSVNIL